MKESTIYVIDAYTKSVQNRPLQIKFYWVVVDHIMIFTGNNDQDFPGQLL